MRASELPRQLGDIERAEGKRDNVFTIHSIVSFGIIRRGGDEGTTLFMTMVTNSFYFSGVWVGLLYNKAQRGGHWLLFEPPPRR